MENSITKILVTTSEKIPFPYSIELFPIFLLETNQQDCTNVNKQG